MKSKRLRADVLPEYMLCYLSLDYAGFADGQRYRLEARHQLLQTES